MNKNATKMTFWTIFKAKIIQIFQLWVETFVFY